MPDAVDIAEQLERHLNSPKQTWLLGAGVSFQSNIPLMYPLTEKVVLIASEEEFAEDEEALRVIEFIKNDVSEGANIEQMLTHLSDLISISERSRSGCVALGEADISKDKLVRVHLTLLRLIGDIVRWGYKPAILGNDGNELEPANTGTIENRIVTVDEHREFVRSIFGPGRAGLDFLRTPVEFFTTNYDTLLEDALALEQIAYQDGFTGGGIGFWQRQNYASGDGARAVVTKLHGSIDWLRPEENPSALLRVREGDKYPGKNGAAVMIYPQATKYVHTQQDPFSDLFQRLRSRLANGVDQVLLICGYSFSDEHINAEIEAALAPPRSQLTIVGFAEETGEGMPTKLQTWRTEMPWRDQLFVVSQKGLYQGTFGPFFTSESTDRDWWTFSGVSKLFSSGLPKDIQELIQ